MPLGDPPPKTELAERCERAIADFFAAVNKDKRSMEARLGDRKHARRLYELAAETSKLVSDAK